jgi:uncharacterized protein YndB with AHSA1/START domain
LYWTTPNHVIHWNFASDDWHCPIAKNPLEIGATFSYTMAAKDGSVAFDFEGTYTDIIPLQKITYTILDGRKVEVLFSGDAHSTHIIEIFEPETVHSIELQEAGWLSILNQFKRYCELSK